mgnify:CR=1 FL=1
MVNLGNEWDSLLAGEFEKPYYLQLYDHISKAIICGDLLQKSIDLTGNAI